MIVLFAVTLGAPEIPGLAPLPVTLLPAMVSWVSVVGVGEAR